MSPPLLGSLLGLAIVLLLALVVSRSNARTHRRRMELLRQKIERRQAKLDQPGRDSDPRSPSADADDSHE